jgi:hypothetical protein
MYPTDNPGCWGTAARLPNWPDNQKATPPSSDLARSAVVAITASASAARKKVERVLRDLAVSCPAGGEDLRRLGFIIFLSNSARTLRADDPRPSRDRYRVIHPATASRHARGIGRRQPGCGRRICADVASR